jgi:hypothetical protein
MFSVHIDLYEKSTFRPSETVSVNTSAFVGTNPTGELITSGLPVTNGADGC